MSLKISLSDAFLAAFSAIPAGAQIADKEVVEKLPFE